MDMYKNCSLILACPDCGGKLSELVLDTLLGFTCGHCRLVFPVADGIPIVLGSQVRNWKLEHALVASIRKQAKDSLPWLQPYIDVTLDLLDQRKSGTTWEWEDEAYWTRAYEKEAIAKTEKNWNDRIWQRDYLVSNLIRHTSLKGKVILDVGSGEGQNFRFLLSDYCDDNTLYIASDISLSGLRLNRSRNSRHANSIYLLCSADCLPIRANVIDVLCYFGILHHTSKKARNLQEQTKLVKRGGYIVLHESLSRPTLSLGSFTTEEKSSHEEYIQRTEIDSIISTDHLEVLASRAYHTVFLTAMMKLFGVILIRSRWLFRFTSWLDIALMKLLCHIIPQFGPGSLMLLLRNRNGI